FRRVDIGRGAVTSLPSIHDRFTPAEVPGIEGFTTHAQLVGLIFSTLNDADMPTEGLYARGLAEFSATALGSGTNYRHYLAEIKGFSPLDGARFVTATRVAYNQARGDDVPFLELSILGGKNSLRGFGDNRFVDQSYVLLNVEERIRLFRY